jgi:hypothetical protein
MIRRPSPPFPSSPLKFAVEYDRDRGWTVEGAPLGCIRRFPDLPAALEAAQVACNAAPATIAIWHEGIYICMIHQEEGWPRPMYGPGDTRPIDSANSRYRLCSGATHPAPIRASDSLAPGATQAPIGRPWFAATSLSLGSCRWSPGRLHVSALPRFATLRCFDGRLAIIDRKQENEMIVFCQSEDEARPILTALNVEVSWRRARKREHAHSLAGESTNAIPCNLAAGRA